MYVAGNHEVRSCNHCCTGEAKGITYAECAFVALGILQAMRIAVLFSLACSALPYFSILYQKRTIFSVELLNIKHVFDFLLQLPAGTFLILRRIQRDTVMHVHQSTGKVPATLVVQI
jgi:hypothetical protein